MPSHLSALISHATNAFIAQFHQPPRHIASATGRVNLIGEHTDYNQGFVLPTPLSRHAHILASPTHRQHSTCYALDLDERYEIDLTQPLKPLPEPRWMNYLLGVVDQFKQHGHEIPNLDLLLTSTIPIGAGLGSSAAIEVAMASALEDVLGIELMPQDKALWCQQSEHTFPGTPCGIMDMLVAVSGQSGWAQLIDCRSCESRAIPLWDAREATLLIVDTQVRHDLTSGEYANRRTACEAAAKAMGVTSLRDTTLSDLNQTPLDPVLHRRAQHVIEENQRTLDAAAALKQGDLKKLGQLMFASHDSLRDLYQVSCPELDIIVDAIRTTHQDLPEVFGARMTGGGFGGSAIVLCHTSAVDTVTQYLQTTYARYFKTPLLIFQATDLP